MYTGIKHLHSYVPYILLALLLISIVIFFGKASSKKTFAKSDKRLALFTFIAAHIQLTLGLILYIISPIIKGAFQSGEVMSDSTYRFYAVEHILTMLIAITFITLGYIRAKKAEESSKKFKTLAIFYLLGLIFALARIPWDVWPN